MQVWIVDKNGFWVDDADKKLEDVTEFDIKIQPIKENGGGFYRAKWDFENKKWIEGATEEEIQELEESNKIDICPGPTQEERIKELETIATEQAEYSVDLDFRLSMIEISL